MIKLETAPGCIVNGVPTLNCLPYVFQNIIFWLLIFAGIVALILIIISGIKFITSGGDAKQAEGARKMLTFAIIGLVLILLSFAIIRFIEQTAGLNPGCITKFGFDQCAPQCEINADCGNPTIFYCDSRSHVCRNRI